MVLELRALFTLDDTRYRQRFKTTPLWRPKRRGLLRNAAIVLGNQASADSVDALMHGLDDDEPIVRGASAWALGRLASHGSDRAMTALKRRQATEQDAGVLQEIAWALDEVSPSGSQPANR
jgi:epoxyqueuosine reductase